MGDLGWKIKRFFKKALPIALVVAVVYGAYSMYRGRAFRHGIGPAVTSVLRKIPIIGSRFRHYGGGRSYSYGHRGGHRKVWRRHHGRRRHRR